jgi:hypothetical protein
MTQNEITAESGLLSFKIFLQNTKKHVNCAFKSNFGLMHAKHNSSSDWSTDSILWKLFSCLIPNIERKFSKFLVCWIADLEMRASYCTAP